MKKIRNLITALLVIIFFPASVHAASLSFFPSIGEYTVGNVFQVSINVASPDKVLNAASGVISFPKDKLEILSISKQRSIITFWVQGPAFLNNKGTLSFEGIVFNPGFRGEKGEIITINFKVKAEGSATLDFVSGAALANDGLGTNILSGMGKANFNFAEQIPTILEATTTLESTSTPNVLMEVSPQTPLVEQDINNQDISRFIKFNWESSLNAEFLKFALLILIVIFLILVVLWSILKTYAQRTKNIDPNLHGIFSTLKSTLQKEIIVFEKMRSIPEIIEEEKKVIESLSKEIDKTEELVKKEIERNKDGTL